MGDAPTPVGSLRVRRVGAAFVPSTPRTGNTRYDYGFQERAARAWDTDGRSAEPQSSITYQQYTPQVRRKFPGSITYFAVV